MRNRTNGISAESSCSSEHNKLNSLTVRVVLLMVLVSILIAYWTVGEVSWGTGSLGYMPDASVVPSLLGIFLVFVLGLFSFRFTRVASALKLDLRASELVALYVGVAFLTSNLQIGTTLMYLSWSGVALSEYFYDSQYYSHVEYISKVLLPWNREAVDDMILGGASVPWSIWLVPMIMWALIYMAIFFLLFCLGSIFHDRWSMQERLSYPLTQPVIQLCEAVEGKSTEYSLKNKVFTLGIVIPLVLNLLGLLHHYFPVIPSIPLSINFGDYVGDGPSAFGQAMKEFPGTWIRAYPFAIGIGYFLPADFGFSIWFFYYVVQRFLMNVVFINAGLKPGTWGYTDYTEAQFQGGVIALALFLIWMGRSIVKDYLVSALGKQSKLDSANMPIHPKLVVFGGLACIAFLLVVGCTLMSTSPFMMLVFLSLIMCFALVYARTRAEAGIPATNSRFMVPNVLVETLGSDRLSHGSIMGLLSIGTNTAWAYPTSCALVMEGLKMADDTKMRRQSMMNVFFVASILVFAVGSPILLKGMYEHGLGVGMAANTTNYARSMLWHGFFNSPPMRYKLGFSALGFVLVAFFSIMHARSPVWPFHPLGYLWGMQMDFSFRYPGAFLIAWLVKVLTLRYGGVALYNKLKPFFIALVLGDILTQVFSNLVQLVVGVIA